MRNVLNMSFVVILAISMNVSAQNSFSSQPVRPQQTFFQKQKISSQSVFRNQENKLSVGKAFLFSFLLPGAGEYYAGSKKMALTFIGSEVLIWSTYFTARTLGRWKLHDAEIWAAAHAGINLKNKNHALYIAVENYNNINDYNNAKLQQRNVAAMYPENEVYSWQWDSKASRRQFEKIRVSSDAWFGRSKFIIAGVILNHLISGIDAVRLVKEKNNLYLGVTGLPEGGFLIMAARVF